MINLSQNDRNIIAQHTLSKCLNHLQESLRKAEQICESSLISYNDTLTNQNQESQKTISRIFYILQDHEAIFNFRSKIENEDLASELFSLFKRARTDSFYYQQYRFLSELVIKKTSDVDI